VYIIVLCPENTLNDTGTTLNWIPGTDNLGTYRTPAWFPVFFELFWFLYQGHTFTENRQNTRHRQQIRFVPLFFFENWSRFVTIWRRSQNQICSRKKSPILRTFSWNSSFRIPFYCVPSSGLWSGFMNSIMKGYERLPPIMKGYERCSKILRIRGKIRWNEFCPFHEITGFTLKKSFRIRILREFGESRDFFCEQIWSCDRRNTVYRLSGIRPRV